MFYVYGEHDPHCSCCSWSYSFDEFDDENDAQWEAAKLSLGGYEVTIVKGEEIPFDDAVLERLKKIKRAEREKREKDREEKELERKRLLLERLKEELGEV